MNERDQEIARLKAAIGNMLRRAPQKVVNGGQQMVAAYKEAVDFAKKAVNAKRDNFANLQQAYTKLAAYES